MSFAQHLRRVDDHNGWLFPIRSSYRARGLTYSIVRYSEFRNIPSCPFLPMADADKARRADFLNSEYSCQSTWRQKQKWIVVSPKTKSFEGTRICVAAGPEIKNGASERIAKSASLGVRVQGRRRAAGVSRLSFNIPSSSQ